MEVNKIIGLIFALFSLHVLKGCEYSHLTSSQHHPSLRSSELRGFAGSRRAHPKLLGSLSFQVLWSPGSCDVPGPSPGARGGGEELWSIGCSLWWGMDLGIHLDGAPGSASPVSQARTENAEL